MRLAICSFAPGWGINPLALPRKVVGIWPLVSRRRRSPSTDMGNLLQADLQQRVRAGHGSPGLNLHHSV